MSEQSLFIVKPDAVARNLAFGGIVFDPIWRASVSLKSVFLPVVLMMLTSIVASIYPASIAARIKPVEAIHYKP